MSNHDVSHIKISLKRSNYIKIKLDDLITPLKNKIDNKVVVVSEETKTNVLIVGFLASAMIKWNYLRLHNYLKGLLRNKQVIFNCSVQYCYLLFKFKYCIIFRNNIDTRFPLVINFFT